MSSYLQNDYLTINWDPSSYNGIELSTSPESASTCHSRLYLKGYDDPSSYNGRYYIYLDAWDDSDGATLKMDSDAKYHNSIELSCPGHNEQESKITLTGGYADEDKTYIYPGRMLIQDSNTYTSINYNSILTYSGSFYTGLTIGSSNNSQAGTLKLYRPSSTNKWLVKVDTTSGELVFTYS